MDVTHPIAVRGRFTTIRGERSDPASVTPSGDAVVGETDELAGHGVRTARIAVAIARVMGLAPDEINAIGLAARLHDVGKTKVDPAVLHKPGPLDADEWMELKRHPQLGYDMLRGKVEPKVARMVLMHHERLDGGGYPAAVGAAQIGMSLRVLQVADAYDAITSTRPYQRALPVGYAITEMTAHIGTQFDPDPVQALLSIVTYQLDHVLATDPPSRVASPLAG